VTGTCPGTTIVTLSAPEQNLHVGDRINVGASNGYIAEVNTWPNTTVLTMSWVSGAPSGSGLAISYVPPTFIEVAKNRGAISDSTGTPGAATQNAYRGRVAIAAGASSVVVTNSFITATSCVFAQIQNFDATLTTILRVVPGAGSFTIQGNVNATAAVNVCWRLEEP